MHKAVGRNVAVLENALDGIKENWPAYPSPPNIHYKSCYAGRDHARCRRIGANLLTKA